MSPLHANKLASHSIEAIRNPIGSSVEERAVLDRQAGIRDELLYETSFAYFHAYDNGL